MINKGYIFHGYHSGPDANWFPWLEKQAKAKLGINLTRLSLPNPNDPNVKEWDAYADQHAPAEDNLVIIGHSLGVIAALRYINQHDIKHARVILVSGFDEHLPLYPELDLWIEDPIKYADLNKKVDKATVFTAVDDLIVPYPYALAVARHLQSKAILYPKGGHLNKEDNNMTTFPDLLEELTKMVKD